MNFMSVENDVQFNVWPCTNGGSLIFYPGIDSFWIKGFGYVNWGSGWLWLPFKENNKAASILSKRIRWPFKTFPNNAVLIVLFWSHHYVEHVWNPYILQQHCEYASILSKWYQFNLWHCMNDCHLAFYPQCNVPGIFSTYHYVGHTWKPYSIYQGNK